MKKTLFAAVILVIVAGSSTLMSECFSDRSPMAHLHYFDGTRIQMNLLKHWLPENPRDFEGAYQDNGYNGGLIIIAHLSDPNDPHSRTVYTGSFVMRDDRNSNPVIHNFSNISIKDGKIEENGMQGRFYRYPDYESQREYYCVFLNDRFYIKTISKRRKIDIDEVEQDGS